MRLDQAPRFLTHLELAAELAHLSYKPDYHLSLFVDPWEGSVLRIVVKVPDAYHPDQLQEQRINTRLPPFESVAGFRHYLLWRLIMVEIHEAREFLRRDGVPISDPHDPIEPA
jgi:hypothetical protein